ncbi:MAG: DEAD/DEAH box helicase [Myxococcales bacterium]|nr:DEAD/DEAH box helicase [Myxococcales bacterium]
MHFRPRRRRSASASASSSATSTSAPRGQAQRHLPPSTLAAFAPASAPPRLAAASPEELAAVAASPFTALGLAPELVRAVLAEGYDTPTPIQTAIIPSSLAGRDVIACAQTGTGKTAAFVLPLLQRLAKEPANTGKVRVLILTPTRELAAQIGERIGAYGRQLNIRHVVVYGGVSQLRQEIALEQRPDIVVATPGRLLDLTGQGKLRLDGVTDYVLDEADRMLDMGFVHDVRRVTAQLPRERRTLFFSATFPPAIEGLASSMLRDPVRASITPAVTTAEGVHQTVMFVHREDKRALLEKVLSGPEVERAIVFTRTKHGANRLSEQLDRAGIGSAAIHGNKSQGARERALEGFRAGTTRVLVATDLAARGIDVDGISHVINFELPNVPESYVHRIGRTGRAGAKGRAISFCDGEERPLLADIERFIRARITQAPTDLPPRAEAPAGAAPALARPSQGGRPGGGAGGSGSSRGRGFRGSRRT